MGIFLFLFFAPINSSSLATTCLSHSPRSCQDIQSYREGARSAWESETTNYVSHEGRTLASNARSRIRRDAERILSELRDRNFSRFSSSDLELASNAFLEQAERGIASIRMQYQNEILRHEYPFPFLEWIHNFIWGRWRDALSGTELRSVLARLDGLDEETLLYSKQATVTENMRTFLLNSSRFKNDRERFQYLVRMVRTEDRAQEFPGRVTPYHARMLLLFRLFSLLSPSEQNRFAQSLEIKTNITKFFPSLSDGSRTAASYLFHDGYFFGSLRSWGDTLVSRDVAPEPIEHASADCSAFVQKVLEESGYAQDLEGHRMTTEDLVNGDYGTLFEKTPLCNETELMPGDLVLRLGHIYLFTGYGRDRDEDPLDFRIVEATGGFSRSIRHANLPIYPDPSDCSISEYSQDVPYFRLRLAHEPPNAGDH